MEIIDWKIMCDGLNKEIINGIVLYGASLTGKNLVMLLDELDLRRKVLAVVDSSENRWGEEWMGYIIESPGIIKRVSDSAVIVITSVYLKEIYENLKNNYKVKQSICSVFSFRHALHYDIYNDVSSYIGNYNGQAYKNKYILWRDNQILVNATAQKRIYYDMIKSILKNSEILLLCSISKVGNESLIESLHEEKRPDVFFTRHALYYNKSTLKQTKEIIQNFDNHKIKIISGVREPIERIISLKWQVISFFYLHEDKCITTLIDEKYHNCISSWELYENLNGTEFNSSSYCYPDVSDWFSDHIEKVFGINVFDYSFDKEKGYTIVNKGNVSIFIYRLDKLDKLENEIKEFSGDRSFKLERANIASEKKYTFAYEKYLEDVKVKREFFGKLVNSRGMKHFYTKEECENYRNKWKYKLV